MDPTTAIALKMAPVVLAKLGQAQGNTVKAVCDAVKTVGCKDQIALTDAIHALGPECAAISAQFVKMLNESVQLQSQTNSKNYNLIVDVVASDPNASTKEKAELFVLLHKSYNEQNRKNEIASALASAIGTVPLLIPVLALVALKISGDRAKISENQLKAVMAIEKTKQGKNLLEFIARLFKKGT